MRTYIFTLLFFLICSAADPRIIFDLTYQDFNSGKTTGVFYDCWNSNPAIDKDVQPIKDTGKICLKITATGNNGGTVGIYPAESFYENIKNYTFTDNTVLSMMVLDRVGQHTFECKIFDTSGNIYTLYSNEKSQKDKWQRVFWRMKNFIKLGLDPVKISKIEIFVYEDGKYYYDDFKILELSTEGGKSFGEITI
ncbi:MAG: hypothetical protein PHO00_06975 [bacterium]|nr:hypothetical protein [bacterium]